MKKLKVKHLNIKLYFFVITLLACLIFTLIGCIDSSNKLTAEDLNALYNQAVKDAEIAEPGEISTNLIAIVPSNETLQWNEEKTAILATTWTSWDGYDNQIGNSIVLSREVWITVAPELKNFCRSHELAPSTVPLRLEQLLGLPPQSGKTRFVEMWVSPNDLFRPSPDPEISDREAELDFPLSSQFTTISPEYQKWFQDLTQQSYGEDGYPWTRLGYTYDWGNPKSEIGLSEFVVRAGASVSIHAVTETLNYCQ